MTTNLDYMALRKAEQDEQYAQQKAAIAFFGEGHWRKHRIKTAASRPVCPCCGKAYGERVGSRTEKQYRVGEPLEPYQGNEIVVEEWLSVGSTMGPEGSPGARLTRHTWDGASYRSKSGSDPFCTQTCCVKFAKAAYRAGYRIKGRE